VFPLPGFSPRPTDRPVVSCYTDCSVLRKENGLKFKKWMKKFHHEFNKNVNFLISALY